jgi:integrase
MENQFTCYKRKNGIYYLTNKETKGQKSLRTRNKAEAMKLTQAYNDAANQPMFNLALARVYLAGTDPKLMTRTWQHVMSYIVERRSAETKRRWRVATLDKNFDSIRKMPIVETRPEHFLEVLADGKPSTNVYLRRIHNYALGMEWLLKSVLPKLLWPKPIFKRKRAITEQEHRAIIAAETAAALRNQGSRNSDEPHYFERRDFYEFLWHTGASQSDAAHLLAEDINWQARTIGYIRRKLRHHDPLIVKPALVGFGEGLADLLRRRPRSGPLFPYLCTVRPGDRATEFKQRCDGLKIKGVTLHSYRYAWAERAVQCGYPMRFSQEALGHNSKAVHYAYSKNAEVIIPSLADWEQEWHAKNQTPAPPHVRMPTAELPLQVALRPHYPTQ